MSRWHPEQGSVHRSVVRADRAVVEALQAFPTTQIADSGGPIGVVGPGIVAVTAGADFCGTAVTVWTAPGDIRFPLIAPDVIEPGDVLVVDGGGRLDAALLGDFAAAALARRGAVGLVVDGAVRDVAGLREVGLPVLARGAHPSTGTKDGPGAINVTVPCGGVVVRAGDVVRADESGVVIVPREVAADVLALTRQVAERELGWQRRLAAGESLPEVVGFEP